MKYCPNPECPYTVRHHEAGEYRDEAVTCSDCGTELASSAPPTTAPAQEAALKGGPLALTLLAPLVVAWLAPKVPLPGFDAGRVESVLGAAPSVSAFGAFGLGLGPMVSAALLVELAALCVPRWRALRIGGPSGRGRLLWASRRLAVVLALVQSLGIVLYLEKLDLLQSRMPLPRLLVILTLIGGTCALVALAELLDRVALGGGYAVLIAAFSLPAVVALGQTLSQARSSQTTSAWGALLLTCGGTAFFLRWRPLDAEGRRSMVPLPACGLLPINMTAAIVTALVAALALGLKRPDFTSDPYFTLALTAGLAMGLGFLFNRPSKVAAFDTGASGRVLQATALSTGYVLALTALALFVARQFEGKPAFEAIGLVPLVLLVAVALDVIAEAGAIRRHGELVSVWPEHRLYAVESARRALDRGGIPSLARSAHQRVLWQFFGPLIPVQIMVPRERAEDASRLLHEHFSRPDRTPEPATGTPDSSPAP
jgi:hypothetical protein